MNATARIELTPIENSSQLEAYGYDAETATLAVRFKGKGDKPGTLYHYGNVGLSEWHAFRDAESKGGHFIRNIKPHADRYPYQRVDETPTEQAPE